MSDSNGNGNGHQKVFELARVKTPEELRAEAARKSAPAVRTSVSFMRLPMAAKGFFSALVDLSFLFSFGGNGAGKIFCTVRDLAKWLKHDKDSITEWRRILVEHKVLWYQEGWPRSEWRITALCPAPERDFSLTEELFVAGKGASLQEGSGKLPPAYFLAPNGDSPSETEEIRQFRPKDSPTMSDTSGQTVPHLPLREGNPSATSVRHLPPECPTGPDKAGESLGHSEGNLSDSVAEGFRTCKESPKEKGSKGDKECVGAPSHTPALQFEPLDSRMVMRLRRKHGPEMIERLKAKRFVLETGGRPPANRKALMDAYSTRIRQIRDWMDGILVEENLPAAMTPPATKERKSQ